MIIYQATKAEFVRQTRLNEIEDIVRDFFVKKIGYDTSDNEIRAWRNSLHSMADVLGADLDDNPIPDNAGIAIEFKIPNTSKRVDFIISGKDENCRYSAVIVELKQWESAEVSGKEDIVKTYVGKAIREVTHPSYQAWSYASLIEDYNKSVQDNDIKLYPCAFLHNYKEVNPPVILAEEYKESLSNAPAFMKGDVRKLKSFIQKYIKYGDDKETLFFIDNGKIRPSKSLQDALSNMLNGNSEFKLLDDQKLVYESAFELARKSHKDGKKRVLIVRGGPGTGKSVVSIELLVNLTNQDMVGLYVTKNSAPRQVYAARLSGKKYAIPRVNNLFKSSGNFVDSSKDEFDFLIVDEAHRLNERSGLFKNKGENQIKEIIHSAKFSIFFIDESQRVTLEDIGSVDEIKKFAIKNHADVTEMELQSQFRCNGSDGYIAWLDDVLQIRSTANETGFDLDYDIQVFDSPTEVRDLIFKKNKESNKARLLAGYCWNWIKSGKNKSDVYDIDIPEFDFKMSWNLEGTKTWAIDTDSVNEIGCIHTSQGLEFEYIGVIIGDDLRFENGNIITDFTKRAHTDQSLKGIKKRIKENSEKGLALADQIIKNTYKTLMTRGMKGCYIYCTDKRLSQYLKKRIESAIKNKSHL